ncbi:MAG: ribosomal protein S18-alanine N-acetyltransferase [Bacilli bacterium]|nr:ribosomal protein S18-alanine N-acetyltransferase [Bacilli bacterium]
MIRKPSPEELKYLYELVESEFSVKYSDNIYTNWLIYETDNKIVGFLNYDSIYDKAEIEYIYVNPSYRNNNIATNLLNEMIRLLNECNINSITLEVRSDNLCAIKFYEKNKFKNAAIRKNYYGAVDAILMIRSW